MADAAYRQDKPRPLRRCPYHRHDSNNYNNYHYCYIILPALLVLRVASTTGRTPVANIDSTASAGSTACTTGTSCTLRPVTMVAT